MTEASSSTTHTRNRATYSCIRCADRKVKCDRQRPCSACVKHDVECLFQVSRPPRKRPKRIQDQQLVERLRQYEALLQQQGVDLNKIPSTPDSGTRRDTTQIDHAPDAGPEGMEHLSVQSPSSVGSESSKRITKMQVVHGQGRSALVDNHLWARVVEEFDDNEDALDETSSEASEDDSLDEDYGFLLNDHSKTTKRWRHPPSERIHQLFQIFMENVDPLTKVVHVPSLRPAVQRAATNTENIPRGFEALIFAIYGAAVMSLKDEDCQQKFNEPRKTLFPRYLRATRAALIRAKFMGTTNLVVLQALVLHLITIRDYYEPRAVWSLTGVAVRIAQGMGLERDGSRSGVPPFEAEMRRRLWWLLKAHDYRTAELCGLPKFQDLNLTAESTKGPSNVNDDQLYPGMVDAPVPSSTVSDAVFMTMRHELVQFAAGRMARLRQQGLTFAAWSLNESENNRSEIDDAIKEIESLLESKYIRYCDPSQPLQLLTMLTARFSLNIVRFLSRHPRKWASIEQIPSAEHRFVWELTLKLLEQHQMAQTNPQLRRFFWAASYYLHWHAFIHVLDVLRANPLIAEADKAWSLVAFTYEHTPDLTYYDTKRPISVAVASLCLKAYGAREAVLRDGGARLPPTPEFILKLRQLHEAARAKKEAKDLRNGHFSKTTSDLAQPSTTNKTGMSFNAGLFTPSDTSASTDQHGNLGQTPDIAPTAPETTTATVETDPFWLGSGFEETQAGDFSDVMDIDFGLGPEAIQSLDANANSNSGVTWDQWDSWLAESNLNLHSHR